MNTYRVQIDHGTTTYTVFARANSEEAAFSEAVRALKLGGALEGTATPTNEPISFGDSNVLVDDGGFCWKKIPSLPAISEELFQMLVEKYAGWFQSRYPKLTLAVYLTDNGQPPVPIELWDEEFNLVVAGKFVKVENEYRIGIMRELKIEAKIMAFFHEYGHALYRRRTAQIIDNEEALVGTETAAHLKSLELADKECLPTIAQLAVSSIQEFAKTSPIHRAAMQNICPHELWKKYAADDDC